MNLDASRATARFEAANVSFVLVEPQYAGNAGAAARALKNLGFGRLCLVRPEFARDDPRAERMAVDARDVLRGATLAEDLDGALGSVRTVVGTTARAGRHRQPHWRLDELGPRLVQLAGTGELAVVFGREDRGLSDAELDRCTHLVYLPGAPEYPSFNVAQAVLLVAYELRRNDLGEPQARLEPPARQDEREAMFAHLREALWAIGFVHADSEVAILRRVRRLVGRAEPSEREVRLLRGLARQILWAARGTQDAVRTRDGDDDPG